MIQFPALADKALAMSDDLCALGMKSGVVAELVFPLVNGSLEFQGELGLTFLDDEVREDLTEKISPDLASDAPVMLVPLVAVPLAVRVHECGPSELLLEQFGDFPLGHSETDPCLESDVRASGSLPARNADGALSVEQSSNVPNIEHVDASLSFRWNDGEFGGHPMPGSDEERGRAIPSQAGDGDLSLGVCNEHVPSAKAKICSELHGNMQRVAEMTTPATVYMWQVTDCNTKYLKLTMKAGADFITTDFVEPDNQAAKVAKILAMLQLESSNRRRLGTLHSLTAPA